MSRQAPVLTLGLLSCLALLPSPDAHASSPVTFTDIAPSPSSGLSSYQRTPSARHADMVQFLQDSLTTPVAPPDDIIITPMRHRGIPGVAIFDFDGDGDQDIYVTNGPGTPNSLFSNQLIETGTMSFVDVSAASGAAATAQDSNGVCYGDIDNDGDKDLMVVGHSSATKLFKNNGDGTFTDISASAGINQEINGNSCVMGDIDQDGRLDIFIARGYSLDTLYECFIDPFSSDIKANDLYLNNGNNTFSDVSSSSGIRDLVSGGMPAGANTITWSAALVDYDQDGDLDLLQTDDQCNYPGPAFGGFSRGSLQLFKNDGTGQFTNHTLAAGLSLPSEWMGSSWADFNHDGHLDVFVTSFGEWGKQFVGAPIAVGDESSRWYLGDGQGGFTSPGQGSLIYNPFGWGTSAEDFDNDGHTDIVFRGGLDMVTIIEKSNPGAMLFNDGNANFTYEPGAHGNAHRRRNDSGVAAGDLNGDGFVDIVSVSNFNVPAPLPLVPFSVGGIDYGSPWDPAFFMPLMDQGPDGFSWNGITFPNGTISVELNNGESNHGSVEVEALGTVGLLPGGKNNRDGIGATISFTPHRGQTAIKPVLGGSSHVSQDSISQHFGFGRARKGVLDVLWPGGVRNRLYNVRAGDYVRFPEIPCSIDGDYRRPSQYYACVGTSLHHLYHGGYITWRQKAEFFVSAVIAYHDR